jgi:predicted O-linked N-acetylglucosamine transferase (SPINDLY family)
LQAGFLGFTGTMGSAAYDFIVADRYCIPPASVPHYVETPLYIDPCYLPSDSRRTLGPVPDRIDYGLPGDAIVLCAFANTYKILPAMFDAWMSLLVRHPRALLWLRDAGEEINLRLREEARARNVDATRLAFAPKEPPARYLARFRLADLFVDTSPFGAHTTLNDALFAGLPAVSIEGRTFAARASASQLRAAGLEALVAGSVDDYVRIADRLIANPGTLRALAERLRAAAAQTPLFDMDRYTRAFERAIEGAVEARCAGAK